MALWYCLRCTAGYAVGLAACPQCGAAEHEEEHEHMAKITSAGPSYEPGKDPNETPAEPGTADAGPVDETGADETTPGGAEASADAQPNPDGVPDGPQDGEHELPPPPPTHE
jgi:hypothetical protein